MRKSRFTLFSLIAIFVTSTVGGQTFYLDQGWNEQQRQDFYFTPQGSQMIPFDWFLNLEQSDSEKLFRDADNIRAYGYLPLDVSERNPHGLPIGFVKDGVDPDDQQFAKIGAMQARVVEDSTRYALKRNFLGQESDETYYPKREKAWLGLTCAACHTHEIELGEKTIRIDGGATQADFESFLTDLGVALETTRTNPEKFRRFAAKLGRTEDDLNEFGAELKQIADAINRLVERNKAKHPYGFARLDAFGAILNAVCETALNEPANRRESNAPVSYPSLWNTPQMGYVQWSASADFPESRNVGEVLGVFGFFTVAPGAGQFDSTIRLKNLIKLEHDLLKKLTSPAWPENALGRLQPEKIALGETLFKKNCQSCHGVRDADGNFELNDAGRIPIRSSTLAEVKTDPQFMINLAPTNQAETGVLSPFFGNQAKVPRVLMLRTVVQKTLANRAVAEGVDLRCLLPGDQATPNPNGPGYIARPLEGIWATAPYFHNGSVPNLYETLLPAAQRSKSFWVGTRKFDPEKVGFVTDKSEIGFEFKVVDNDGRPIPGNLNVGHEGHGANAEEGFTQTFENGVWRDFSEDERYALIEYMKSLSSKPYKESPPMTLEQIPDDEAKQIANIVDLTIQQMQSRYKNAKPMLRGVHPKDHGCVTAKFEVLPDLPAKYAVGVFQPGASYEAFIRFSNAEVIKRQDTKVEEGKPIHGSRGMAVKLLGVKGESLLPLHGALTQDFLMVNQPAFAFANVEDYEALSQALINDPNEEKENGRAFFARTQSSDPAVKARALRTAQIVGRVRANEVNGDKGAFAQPPASPVDNSYYSAAPFLLGDGYVMKYRASPIDRSLDAPDVSDPDYLRNALIKRLEKDTVVFDFAIQVRSPDQLNIPMDIENASTQWDDEFVTVARITIPPQKFDSPEQRANCERLFFTPWHGLTVHRPIGGINRLRKAVYIASSQLRSLPKEPETIK